MGFAPGGTAALAGTAVAAEHAMVEQVGTISWDHVVYASTLREGIPDELLDAAHSLHTAIDVVLAVLVDDDAGVAKHQLQIIENDLSGDHRERVEAYLPQVSALGPLQRLPLVELAFPALRRRPPESIRRYLKALNDLIHADGQVSVFEFSISKLISVYLTEAMQPATQAGKNQNLSLRDVREELSIVFGVLARVGHEGGLEVRRAHVAGMEHVFSMTDTQYEHADDWVDLADKALGKVDRLVPLDKEVVVEGLIKTLAHDGQITLAEVELLRAICASIHCPMPPKLVAA